MNIPILYEDDDVLAVDKPARIVVFPEGSSVQTEKTANTTLIDLLIEEYPAVKNVGEAPRYGVVHRLDKDTSGVLLVAKNPEALIFLQKQFKNRGVEKKYLALVTGRVKEEQGTITTLLGRSPKDPRKQKVHSLDERAMGLREAITEYKVLQRFEGYTFLEVQIKTGRKHQIRAHLSNLHHPVAGDRLYGFKDSPVPEGLSRQFLHAASLKISLPDGTTKEFHSDLPEDLKNILNNLH